MTETSKRWRLSDPNSGEIGRGAFAGKGFRSVAVEYFVPSQLLIQDYAKNYTSMTPESARKMVDGYLTIEADRQKIRRSYLPKFRQVLPEIKVARPLPAREQDSGSSQL